MDSSGMDVYMYVCIYTCHTCTPHTNIHTTMCTYTQIPPHTQIHTYIQTTVCTYTHTYTHIHKYIHEYIPLKMKERFGDFLPCVFSSVHVVPASPAMPGTDPSLTSPCQSMSRRRDAGPRPRRNCCFQCQQVSAAFIFKGKTEKPSGYLNKATLLTTSFKN